MLDARGGKEGGEKREKRRVWGEHKPLALFRSATRGSREWNMKGSVHFPVQKMS